MLTKDVYARWKCLPDSKRLVALTLLCEDALEVWKKYAKTGNMGYSESLGGMRHVVDDKLPENVLRVVQRRLGGETISDADVQAIDEAYGEPISAMQGFDIEFPNKVEYSYYCIYNLFRLVFNKGNGITEHLVWNQGVSAQLTNGNDADIDAVNVRWWKKVEDRGLAA